MQTSRAVAAAAALAALALVAAAVAAGASRQSGGAEGVPAAGNGVPPVASGEVTLREVREAYSADAVIEAVRAATVSAQIAGQVTRFYVDAGDRVNRGQVLARIDTRETDAQVAAGRANVAQAEAQVAQAQLNFDRTRQLTSQNFVSQAALDKADADLKSARAALEAARAGSVQATTARSFAEVRAPIDGIVTRRLMELGELAAPGRGVVEVHDPAHLRAVGAIPQFVLPQVLSSGAREATVRLPTLDQSIEATHLTILPAADARLLSTQVRADLPAGLASGVMPGTVAKILIPLGTAMKLMLPEQAVVRRGELTATYVIGGDGAPRLRQIRVGEAADAGQVEVLAGLVRGERVRLDPLAAR